MANSKPVVRSKPIPRSRRDKFVNDERFSGVPSKYDRSLHTHRRDDDVKNVSIDLEDIDNAIAYFFNQVLKPKVKENGQMIDVPIIYASPERWKSVQRDGYFKDKKEKLILPLIMFKRNSVSRDSNLMIDKFNRNLQNIVYPFKKKWSKHNKYDRFSTLEDFIPTEEHHNVVIPNYVELSYECSIWTTYVAQTNTIIELLNHAEGTYWGDPNRFKFYAAIDDFGQNIDISTDTQRIIKTDFTIRLKGYLIPESFNDAINTQRRFTTQQILITEYTDTDLSEGQIDKSGYIRTISSGGGGSLSTDAVTDLINQAIQTAVAKYVTYLTEVSYKSGSFIENSVDGESVVTFIAESSSVNDANFITTKFDYLMYVNGQLIPHTAFDIKQSGSLFYLYVATGSTGYAIESTDEIIAWGKFVP